MNSYLIKTKNSSYITNADNLMDAEEKFFNEFPDLDYVNIKQIELSPRLSDDENIVFF